MLGRLGAALAAAAVLAAAASADDPPRPAEPAQPDVTLFESSARLRLNWSEIAFRGNRPKAWHHVVSPEVRANIRVLAGLFEGKAEIGFAAGLLLRRQDTPVEEAHYALSDGGARHLFDDAEIQSKRCKDLLCNVSGHRDAANEVCITALLEGRQVVTDREIQTHYNGGFKSKVPDALIIDSWNGPGGEGQRDYHWVEVEHSRRHPRDLGTFAHWIVEVAFPERCMRDGVGIGFQDGYLQRVTVVIASQYAATIESRLRDAISGIASPSQVEVLWRDRLVFKNLLAK